MLLTTLGTVLLLPFGAAFLLCDTTVAPERVRGEEYVLEAYCPGPMLRSFYRKGRLYNGPVH
jgi:hypothetical protein